MVFADFERSAYCSRTQPRSVRHLFRVFSRAAGHHGVKHRDTGTRKGIWRRGQRPSVGCKQLHTGIRESVAYCRSCRRPDRRETVLPGRIVFFHSCFSFFGPCSFPLPPDHSSRIARIGRRHHGAGVTRPLISYFSRSYGKEPCSDRLGQHG